MAIDLTPVEKAEMMVNRMFLSESIPVLGFNDEDSGWTELASLTPAEGYDWDLEQKASTGPKSKAFLILRIIDIDGFKDIVEQTTTVQYDGFFYKVQSVTRPFGRPAIWRLKLVLTEEVE